MTNLIHCIDCVYWRGERNGQLPTAAITIEEDWRVGKCERLGRVLDIAVDAGWDGGTVRWIQTVASFGCVAGKSLTK